MLALANFNILLEIFSLLLMLLDSQGKDSFAMLFIGASSSEICLLSYL